MLTIKIGNKKIKLLNWIIFILFLIFIIYVIGSLIFLLPMFKTTYEDKITTSNYSIDAKTTYKNKFLSCITKEEYSLNSEDKLIKENLKEELIKDGFKKKGNLLVRKTKSTSSCKRKIKEYEKSKRKGHVTYKLNGKEKIELNYGDSYNDEYITFKINNKRCNDVTISTNLNVKKTGDYVILYNLKNKYYLVRKVSVVDKEKPVINILGDEVEEIDFSSKYKETGFTAYDNYDGDIKNKVKVKGKVNTKRSGTYKLTYKVSDSSGNTDEKTRTVIVKDKTQSTIKSPEIKVLNGITYVEGILLVNKTYHLPKNYDPKVNKEALKNLKKMQADAKALGLSLPLVSGYRSYETQEKLHDKYVKKDGEEVASTYSAKPGESEHQTGLAFDIGSVDRSFANTIEAKWIEENSYLYGFIVRYPKGKTDITGYIYEPWHVRYLGEKTAKDVYLSGLTLEEYLGVN